MREIKFRAWDNLNQVMWDVLQYLPYEGEHGTIKIDINAWVAYMSHDFEIMQFTGLSDKNGKEIYEGDIVNVANKYLKYAKQEDYVLKKVQWNNQRWCWNYFLNENDLMWEAWIYDAVYVIWNIYENTDLLSNK